MLIDSKLLLYTSDASETGRIAVAQVLFRQRIVFVALMLSSETRSERHPKALHALRHALYSVCLPKRCAPLEVASRVAAAVTLLEAFDRCGHGDARMITCSTQDVALHVLALLNLRQPAVALPL